MNLRAMLLISALVGCGDDGGSSPPDAPTAPATITVTGQTDSIGLGGRTPEQGIVVTAHREGDPAIVAMATSDATGAFTMTIETGGVALDGYLLAKGGNFIDTYLYPPGPLAASTDQATCLMLTPGVLDTAANFANATQAPGMGFIGVLVLDAQNNPVAGATIASEPAGEIRYNNMDGFPAREATVTQPDGIAYIFNVPAGAVTVTAAKDGATFAPNDLNARADQVTLTLIQ